MRFWGVRGSLPVPGPSTVNIGGNTACIEIVYDDRRVIIDAGTGIKQLGDYLVRETLKEGPIKTHLFISHTHWDHLLGFPFFTPIFVPGTEITIYSPVSYENEGMESVIGYQLSYRHFPIRQVELSAKISYRELREETVELEGGLTIRTKFLNHPVLCLGYRFEHRGRVICTVYDHEPYRNVFPTDPTEPDYDEEAAREGEAAAVEENQKVLAFFEGADAVVYDSQYTQKEYLQSRLGWGHSSFETAINNAHKGRVGNLFFFHHDPGRSDRELEELVAGYRKMIGGKTKMHIDAAREGLELDLPPA
jgi:phosphoribosyl 1,2-cyclic phosphodiesterase